MTHFLIGRWGRSCKGLQQHLSRDQLNRATRGRFETLHRVSLLPSPTFITLAAFAQTLRGYRFPLFFRYYSCYCFLWSFHQRVTLQASNWLPLKWLPWQPLVLFAFVSSCTLHDRTSFMFIYANFKTSCGV